MNWTNTTNSVWLILLACLVLTACQSTSSSGNQPLIVGPVAPDEPAQQALDPYRNLQYANIFLDVAVPTFSAGFPMSKGGFEIDYDQLDEKGIWPQLRRTEAKLFAVETKNSLEATRAFGAVRVVPDANTTADLFVLGRILESTSETVAVEFMVVDATGEPLGKRNIEHSVSENFFRDQRNLNRNPYQPLFDKGRNFVLSILKGLSDQQKQTIRKTALVRFGQYYNSEAFQGYVSSSIKRKYGQNYAKFTLDALPADDAPMLERIENLRVQEMLFVDRLQDNYDTFYAETQDAYAQWQKETLPEIIAMREARRDRNLKAGLGVGLAVLAGVLSSNSSNSGSSLGRGATSAGAVLAGVGSIAAINEAFKSNAEMKVQNAIIEEQGQAVDLTLSPTEIKFEDDIVELTGTASEQYSQWRQYLKDIYHLEKTPNIQL